jgi:regulator of RNase E activity RraA
MKTKKSILLYAVSLILIGLVVSTVISRDSSPDDPLINGFKKVAIASVADAVDAVMNERGYMNYDMRPVVQGHIVGRAVTSILRPSSKDESTPQTAVKHPVDMMEEAKPGEVGVIVVMDGLNISGIGGLMGVTAKSRDMAGMIIDGGVRDVKELRDMKLPVYGRSITPGTAVGRYVSIAKNIPVQCAGVMVKPGDIIVAGEDGVVRVPKEKAQDILQKAQEIDERESKMVPYIKRLKSLRKAIEEFGRI